MPVKRVFDAATDLGAVERGIPHHAATPGRTPAWAARGEPQFDDIGVAVGGVLVFGHGGGIREGEPDVVGRGPPEVPDHEFDHVPVGGMRLHEHRDLRTRLLGRDAAIPVDLPIGEDQRDDCQDDRRPRRPRHPGVGPDVRDIMPAVLDPTHGIHPTLISQGRSPRRMAETERYGLSRPSASAIGRGRLPDTRSWNA